MRRADQRRIAHGPPAWSSRSARLGWRVPHIRLADARSDAMGRGTRARGGVTIEGCSGNMMTAAWVDPATAHRTFDFARARTHP